MTAQASTAKAFEVCADSFVAAGQPTESGDPFQGAFDDVAAPAEFGRGLDAFAGDPGDDPTPT
jgi:hypothetical protein